MAFNQFVFLAILAIALPTVSMATEYVVGDTYGWTLNFDYQGWAKDKVFRVGDKLVFQYDPNYHNVFKVNGTGFDDCIVPPANEALTSGNDTIILATPGNKWYICGKPTHCTYFKQKLAITVVAEEALAPTSALAPAPTPSYWSAKKFRIWLP